MCGCERLNGVVMISLEEELVRGLELRVLRQIRRVLQKLFLDPRDGIILFG